MSEPVVDQLASVWRSIDELCSDLTEEEWKTPTDLPGWSVQDNVSHMVGTERMLAGDEAPDADLPEMDHVQNQIGSFNEQWVEARRGLPGAEVLAEFNEVTGNRLTALRAMSTEEFDKVGFTPEGEAPYREFMHIRVFDCWQHEQDIRRALGRPGSLDSPAAAQAIDRVTGAMGYIVGKRAGAPQGSTVVFDVEGPIERVVAVGVEGRASLLDTPPAEPTVRITLDTETYNALACGRWSGSQARAEGRVSVEGDEDLGRAVVDNMAYTI